MKSGFRFFLACFGIMLISASSCEDHVSDNSIPERIDSGILAVVTTKYEIDGCEVLLEIEENDEKVLLLPIELEDQYKIDGLKLLITFHSSRIMQSTCQIGRPIVINSVRFVD